MIAHEQKGLATVAADDEAQAHNAFRIDNITSRFMAAMRAVEVRPAHGTRIFADGLIHRYDVMGDKPGRKNGWYVLHPDNPPAGAFGSWRTAQTHTWRGGDGDAISEADRQRFAQITAHARRERLAARDTRQREAASNARAWWDTTRRADANHPYLLEKQVFPYGLRQSGASLLVPLYSLSGDLWNVQTIAGNGTKRFQRGGRITGLAAIVGDPGAGNRLLICEGWATAASLHAGSGSPVLATMNCGNLLPVAKTARQRWPDADIIICGDDDRATEGNPGRTTATAAAKAINARLVFPAFADDEPGTDFNDWAGNRREVVA